MEEKVLFDGKPSEVSVYGLYIVAIVLFFIGIVIATMTNQALGTVIGIGFILFSIGLYAYQKLEIKCTNYTVTEQRIVIKEGVFDRETSTLELYRIRDYSIYEPFSYRIFGKANLFLQSSDRSSPNLLLVAIPLKEAERLQKELRIRVEELRLQKGMREMDVVHNFMF